MSDANKQLARRYFDDIINGRRFDLCHEIVARTYVEHAAAPFSDSEPGEVDGPDATTATVRWLLEQFPDLHFTIDAVVAEGDLVCIRATGEGTNLGPMGPVPATGKRFRSLSSHWFRVSGGRLVEHWATRDDLTSMLQLGVVRAGG